MSRFYDQHTQEENSPGYWSVPSGTMHSARVKNPPWFVVLMALAVVTIVVCGVALAVHKKPISSQKIDVAPPINVNDAVQRTQSQCLLGNTMVDPSDTRVRFDKKSRLPCMTSAMLLQEVLEKSKKFRLKKIVNLSIHTSPEINAVCSEIINHVIVCTSRPKSAVWIFPEGVKA